MSKNILVIPDIHCTPEEDNSRADLLAKLIIDAKPDVVVNMGDQFDMASLSSYDKGKRSFQGKSYKNDLDSGLEFHDRLWGPVRATKKKMPRRIVLEGNHEHRIERALDLSPELEGTIGFKDYAFEDYYHEVVRYEGGTPGIVDIEGILFSHYFISGVMGRPIGGKWPAKSILEYNKQSSVQSHIHVLDYATTITQGNQVIHSLVCGCYHEKVPGWAGNIGKFWRPGVALLRNAEGGDFDLEWISLKRLREVYDTPVVEEGFDAGI